MKNRWTPAGPLAFLLLLLASTGQAQIDAQASQISHYIFSSFTKGIVLQTDGNKSEQLLNYNALTNEMVFDANGKNLALAAPEKVDTVYIENRKFVPAEKKFYEILVTGTYPLAIEYTASIIEQGNDIGFGMKSTTGANQSMKTMIQNGSAYGLKLPDGYQVKQNRTYFIRKESKWQRINGFSGITKLFPEKKSSINETLKKNNLEFSKQQDVIVLLQSINE